MIMLKKIVVFLSLFGCLFQAYADQNNISRNSTNQDTTRIGVGGLYGMNKTSDATTTDTGGYLTLLARNILNQRVLFEVGLDIGLGPSTVSGTYLSKPKAWVDTFSHAKIGLNLVPRAHNPLFINLGYSFDQHITGAYWTNNVDQSFRSAGHYIGLELQRFINADQRLHFEYAIGYWYMFHGYHYLESARSNIDDFSYAIKGQVGFGYNISSRLEFFMNAKVRYYNIAASHQNSTWSYKATDNLIGMVELGIGF